MTTPKLLSNEEVFKIARQLECCISLSIGQENDVVATLQHSQQECERLTQLNGDLTTENKILSGNREADAHDIERLTKEWEVKK